MKKRVLKILLIIHLLSFSAVCILPCHAARSAQQAEKIDIFLFYSDHCKACILLKREFLPQILEQYASKVTLNLHNIADPQSLNLLISLSEQFQRKHAVTPSILIGNHFLVGRAEIEGNLEKLITQYEGRYQIFEFAESETSLESRFREFSFLAIISAGLIDGINPCAFAVIVFFISFLGVYGYSRKEIVYIGIFYIVSVFLTYVLIGLGLFKFLYSLSHFYFLMKIFYYCVAVFCFMLAFFAAYDYMRFKKTGKTEGMVLQLPKVLKRRINFVIGGVLRERKYTRVLELCAIAFFIGFVVSLLEAACTGQVYIPAIAYIMRMPHLRMRALMYLVLYNLMFVFPLIVIFVLSLIGFTSQQFNNFLKRNVGMIKIIMVILFLVLGTVMLWLS